MLHHLVCVSRWSWLGGNNVERESFPLPKGTSNGIMHADCICFQAYENLQVQVTDHMVHWNGCQRRKISNRMRLSMVDGIKRVCDLHVLPGAMQPRQSLLCNGIAGGLTLRSSGKPAAAAVHVQQLKPQTGRKQNHSLTGVKFCKINRFCLMFHPCMNNAHTLCIKP